MTNPMYSVWCSYRHGAGSLWVQAENLTLKAARQMVTNLQRDLARFAYVVDADGNFL